MPATGRTTSGLEIAHMPIELTAHTAAGVRLVSIAEKLSEQLAARAGEHDRDRTYPFEAIEALKAAGYFAAPVPVELGGLGVSSAHDLVVASSRLARGDASVAIGVNMHLVAVQNMERRRQVAVAAGHERRARGFAASLEQVARDGMVLAAAISERSQDLTRPGTSAHRTDSGWRIDGRKFFCTMSPGATHLYVSVRYADDDGVERYAYAMVPTDARGVTVHDDWDALGMRASGSNSVSLDGVELPESGVRGGFRAGDPTPYMERNLMAGLFHAAASLGIAESADQIARRAVARRLVTPNFTTTTHSQTNGATHVTTHLPTADERAASPDAPPGVSEGRDARTWMQVADNAIDLTAARGVLSRAATLIDAHRGANPTSDGTAEELGALFAEAQAAKAFVGEASTRVVDRALALSGGAGYVNGSPLARAYRDVKAGSFMHPLGANRAYDYLAHVALGGAPALH
jgi:alkylation response protein AidB-like acyl-CoA dehydrogenase